MATGAQVRLFLGHWGSEPLVASPDCLVVAASLQYLWTVRLWSAPTGPEIGWFYFPYDEPQITAFSLEVRALAYTLHNTVRVRDVETSRKAGRLDSRLGFNLYSVVYSPDGTRAASGSEDGSVQVWDVAALNLAAPLQSGSRESEPDSALTVSQSSHCGLQSAAGRCGTACGIGLVGA